MKRPLIGITAGLNDSEDYLTLNRLFMDKLLSCGCTPVILPLTDDAEVLAQMAGQFDGFVFSGGGDIEGVWFHEETSIHAGSVSPVRDAMEITLARMLLRAEKPVFGVCRGAQVMAVAAGGTIWQDLPSEYDNRLIAHKPKMAFRYPAHRVDIVPGTLLHSIIGKDCVRVNSVHHQAVKALPPSMMASAAAPDGVIEAVELKNHPFWLGVQWHPERLADDGKASDALFRAFASACGQRMIQG